MTSAEDLTFLLEGYMKLEKAFEESLRRRRSSFGNPNCEETIKPVYAALAEEFPCELLEGSHNFRIPLSTQWDVSISHPPCVAVSVGIWAELALLKDGKFSSTKKSGYDGGITRLFSLEAIKEEIYRLRNLALNGQLDD
jgi:hypothetical protein